MSKLISIIIPAHNEEQYLPQCLKQIKLAAEKISSPVEIIVVINRCTDQSEEIAKNNSCLLVYSCLLYTSPSPRDLSTSRMPSSA